MDVTAHQKYSRLAATIAAIQSMHYIPSQSFKVGDHVNGQHENTGSLAILGFAKLHNLSEATVLDMFGEAAEEVLANPDPDKENHPNIRQFLRHGLDAVHFEKGGASLAPHFKLIEDYWDERANFSPNNAPLDLRNVIKSVLLQLDSGAIRVAMKLGQNFWHTNQAIKKAVLLSFRLEDNVVMDGGPMRYFDKVPTKFAHYDAHAFQQGGFRVVPPAVARRGSFIARNVILMPSFVNIGAYVDEGTMVDAWATVGSCAQIGKNCHLSGGVGIGGVLEPLQANPTIIGDNCFIGARCEVVEGVIVEDNCVLGMGVYIGQSTKIYDRATGEVMYGRVPAGSVVVAGNLPSADGKYSLYCAVIVKRVDAQTRAKTAINELLRD